MRDVVGFAPPLASRTATLRRVALACALGLLGGCTKLTPTPNRAPVIAGVTVTPTPLVPGGTALVRVQASDPDGNPLRFSFSVDGDFALTLLSDPAAATLIAPLRAGAQGTLVVTVEDNHGGTSVAQATVTTLRTGGPVISGLEVTPTLARAGIDLGISFTLDAAPSEDPTVVIGGSFLARKVFGVGAGGYAYQHHTTGVEPEGLDVAVEVRATDAWGTRSAFTTVRFDFTPAAVASIAPVPTRMRAGVPVALTVTANEPLTDFAATLQATPLPCTRAASDRFICAYTPVGTEAQGPQSIAWTMTDNAGNVSHGSAAAGFTFDFDCVVDETKLRLLRGYGSPTYFKALAGATEPGATVEIFADTNGTTSLALATAGADGAVAPLGVGGPERTQAYVRATDDVGNPCTIRRARTTFTANYENKTAGSANPNPSVLRAAAASRRLPTLSEISTAPEVTQSNYTAASVIDTSAMTVSFDGGSDAGVWRRVDMPTRAAPSVTYDPVGGQTLVFGGWGDSADLGDTWTLAATEGHWRQRTGAPDGGPTARSYHAAAFHPGTGKLFVFGGYASGNLNDLWAWNGAAGTWSQVSQVDAGADAGGAPWPSARNWMAMTLDEASGKIVLFGGSGDMGNLGDTWTWDGTAWTNVTPDAGAVADAGADAGAVASSPQPRGGNGLAYYPDSGVVLFGGYGQSGLLKDTWVWNGMAWTNATPSNPDGGPRARSDYAMAYDPRSNRVVLFGGWDAVRIFNDLWEWDGVAWTGVPTTDDPTRWPSWRGDVRMAYDVGRGRVILVGGCTDDVCPSGDAWAWDGVARQWTRITGDAPPSTYYAGMAFDSSRGKVAWFNPWAAGVLERMMFVIGEGYVPSPPKHTFDLGDYWRGLSGDPHPPCFNFTSMAFDSARSRAVIVGMPPYSARLESRTCRLTELPSTTVGHWEWDGLTWAARNTGALTARTNSPIAYDEARDKLVLFGGWSSASSCTSNCAFRDTWEYDATTGWARLYPANKPPARGFHALAYDRDRQKTVLFGGWSDTVTLGDTWTWDGNDWTQVTTANSPSVRADTAMAYNADRRTVLLHGGCQDTPYPCPSGDTWEFDGVNRTQVATGGPATGGQAMAYHESWASSVVFGGYDAARGVLAGTWEFALPSAYAAVLARFDLSPAALATPSRIDLTAVVAGVGAIPGATAPVLGAKLYLWDAVAAAWVAAGTTSAAAPSTLSYGASGANVARFLPVEGTVRALIVAAYGASATLPSGLAVDYLEVLVEE